MMYFFYFVCLVKVDPKILWVRLYYYLWGDKRGSPDQCICWVRGPTQGRTSPRTGQAEEKGDGQPSEGDASDHSMKEDKY